MLGYTGALGIARSPGPRGITQGPSLGSTSPLWRSEACLLIFSEYPLA